MAGLNMKNLMSPTPRNWVLKALILALKDSDEALVSLRSKYSSAYDNPPSSSLLRR